MRFGRGFSRQNLWQMRAFSRAWPVRVAGRLMESTADRAAVGDLPDRSCKESVAVSHPVPGQGLNDSTLRKFSMMNLGPAVPGNRLAKNAPYSVTELPPNEFVVPGM